MWSYVQLKFDQEFSIIKAIRKNWLRNVFREQVISPEQLEERDPTEIALPYGVDGAVVPVQKFRDAQKLCTVMTDGKLEYVIYGTEAQAKILLDGAGYH